MKRLVLVVVALVACKKTPAGSGNADCDLIKKDPGHAMVELTKRYPNNALKVAQTIENCVAPTGDECDRVAAIVKAIPSMSGLSAPGSASDFAATCRSAPPEMRRCYMPSYVIEHGAECKKIFDDLAAITVKQGDMAASPPCDGGTVDVYVTTDGTWIATGKDPASRCYGARKGGSIDATWLETELGQFKTKDCRPSVELAADHDVRYQDVIAAMDVAVKVGLVDVGLSTIEEMAVSFKDANEDKSPQHCPATTIASRAAAGSGAGSGSSSSASHHPLSGRTTPIGTTRETMQQAKVVIVTKDEIRFNPGRPGAPTSELVAKVKDVLAGSGPIAELARELPVSEDGLLILQADQDTPAIVINRIVVTAKAGGYDNVLFAVKNK